MKKLLFFLLLTTAVVGRAQTSLDLLPAGTEAPDFTITDSKTGKKIFQLSDKKTQKDKDGKTVPGVWTIGGKTKCVKMNETLNQWKVL